MRGNYAQGFSLGSYNSSRKRREASERFAHDKAKEHFNTLLSGKMVSIDCGQSAVINALKSLVRGDSRFCWQYDNSNRIHFSPKRKPQAEKKPTTAVA